MTDRKRGRHKDTKAANEKRQDPQPVTSPPRSLGGLKLKISFSAPKPPAKKPRVVAPPVEVNSEDEWTEALESDGLDERGELPSAGPKVMTARQHSMKLAVESREAQKLRRAAEPTYAPVLDKEALAAQEAKRRAASNRRRLIQEKQRREEKESTMAKLLQKQTSATLREDDTRRGHRKAKAQSGKSAMRYINDCAGCSLSTPKGQPFPLAAATTPQYPGRRPTCVVEGCDRPRRYAVASTAQSVCSLAHYRLLTTAQTPIA